MKPEEIRAGAAEIGPLIARRISATRRDPSIRPEHVPLADHEAVGPVIEAEALFIEPMGADTLGWFQYGHNVSPPACRH